MPTRSPRNVLRDGALVLGASLAALGLAELIAHGIHERPWYAELLQEQAAAEKHGYERRRDGLRDREYPSPKPADRLRVLFVGDSFTFGIGVPDDDAVFPAILEQRLDAAAASFGVGGVDVLNGGIPASLTGQWVGLCRRAGADFQPDVVVVVFFQRDGTRLRAKEDFFEPIRDEIAGRNQASVVYRNSALWRLVRDRLDQRTVSAQYLARFRASYFGTPEETLEWRKAQENLLLIRDLASERSATTAVVVFPMLMSLGDDYPLQDISDEIVRFGESNGFPTLDLLPAFRGERAADLWVSPWNQHPNARGHRIAADALEPFVRGLLDQE